MEDKIAAIEEIEARQHTLFSGLNWVDKQSYTSSFGVCCSEQGGVGT